MNINWWVRGTELLAQETLTPKRLFRIYNNTMKIYWCQGLSLPYESIKLSRYCWKQGCFCWGSNKNNKWVYLSSYQALIKAYLAVEWWEIGSAAHPGCPRRPLSFGMGRFSQHSDLKITQDLSDGFPGVKRLLVPWRWLGGTWCTTPQQNLVKGELRLPLVCYILDHILQTSEDLEPGGWSEGSCSAHLGPLIALTGAFPLLPSSAFTPNPLCILATPKTIKKYRQHLVHRTPWH